MTRPSRFGEPKWDLRLIRLARHVSTWSKDPSTHCGAVITRPDLTVVSTGFNGFPIGTPDDLLDYKDRELKLSQVVHAEMNAIVNARADLSGMGMFTWPPGYGPTCDRCAAHVIQSGITYVAGVLAPGDYASRWKEACERGLAHYAKAGVQVTMYSWDDFCASDKS